MGMLRGIFQTHTHMPTYIPTVLSVDGLTGMDEADMRIDGRVGRRSKIAASC